MTDQHPPGRRVSDDSGRSAAWGLQLACSVPALWPCGLQQQRCTQPFRHGAYAASALSLIAAIGVYICFAPVYDWPTNWATSPHSSSDDWIMSGTVAIRDSMEVPDDLIRPLAAELGRADSGSARGLAY
jgi:hypothetical protein